jgi:hypothetical protein
MVIAGLALIELFFLGIFFLMVVFATVLDRNDTPSAKWWVLVGGIAAFAAWVWSDLSVESAMQLVSSWSFWIPVLAYFGIGLAYSCVEFGVALRKAERSFAESWQKMLKEVTSHYELDANGERKVKQNFQQGGPHDDRFVVTRCSVKDLFERAKVTADAGAIQMAQHVISRFLMDQNKFYNIIELKQNGLLEIVPVVNRGVLANYVGAWTVFWPGYAVSLFVGDFLVEVFRIFADMLSNLTGRIVRVMFSNTFKV